MVRLLACLAIFIPVLMPNPVYAQAVPPGFYTFNINERSTRTESAGNWSPAGLYCIPYDNPNAANSSDDAICFLPPDAGAPWFQPFTAFYTFNSRVNNDNRRFWGRTDIIANHYCIPLRNPDVPNTQDDVLCFQRSQGGVGFTGFYAFNSRDVARTGMAGTTALAAGHYCIPLRNPDIRATDDDALCFAM